MVPGRRGQQVRAQPSLDNLGTLTGPRSLFTARYRGPHPPTHRAALFSLQMTSTLTSGLDNKHAN